MLFEVEERREHLVERIDVAIGSTPPHEALANSRSTPVSSLILTVSVFDVA
jgi:hypothetical protein